MTEGYLEPCKDCLLKMCCSQVCRKFISYVEKEFQLGYDMKKFPVPMNLAREHISCIRNGLVHDCSHIRMSEYERRE